MLRTKLSKTVCFQVDEDMGMGDTPWLGLVCAPSDWKPKLGSEILNYAPTLTFKAVQGSPRVPLQYLTWGTKIRCFSTQRQML